MPSDTHVVEISLAGQPHYRRLAEFLENADRHANTLDDVGAGRELRDIVDSCRVQLAELLEG